MDIDHLSGDVGEREVGHDAAPGEHAVGHVVVGEDLAGPADVIVTQHDGFRIAGGARGVDQGAAVPGLGRRHPPLHGSIVHPGAQLQELLPGVHRDVRGALLPEDGIDGLISPEHQSPQVWELTVVPSDE